MPNPGSSEAIRHGCTCDPIINREGRGAQVIEGEPCFEERLDCPLHGTAAVVADQRKGVT